MIREIFKKKQTSYEQNNTSSIQPLKINFERLKNLISLAFVMLVITNLYAQQQQINKQHKKLSPEQRIENRLNKLNEITGGLSDEQKVKIKAILEDNYKQAETDRQKFSGNKEKMYEAREKRRANFDNRLKEILSAVQYEKVIAHRKEMQHKHHKNKAGKYETTPIDNSSNEIYD